MSNTFFKFPHTPHIFWLAPGQPRGDKVLPPGEAEELLRHTLVVEEKVDGANLGLSVGSTGQLQAQNRGTILGRSSHAQFDPLWPWLSARQQQLTEHLGRNLILFGEWCFAVHTVRYDRLPDYFLAFDLYDKQKGEFRSVRERDELCRRLGVSTVPFLTSGVFSKESLLALLGRSRVGSGSAEGIYLRFEKDGRIVSRAKLVQPEFVQGIEQHWMGKKLERNLLASARLEEGA